MPQADPAATATAQCADDQEELDREHRRQHGRDDEAEEAGAAEDEERFF
jgi:hypothetical protein